MLLVTVAAGIQPPTNHPQHMVPFYSVEQPPNATPAPPPIQPPPPLSAYSNPSGAGFPGPAGVTGPAILPPVQQVRYANSA